MSGAASIKFLKKERKNLGIDNPSFVAPFRSLFLYIYKGECLVVENQIYQSNRKHYFCEYGVRLVVSPYSMCHQIMAKSN